MTKKSERQRALGEFAIWAENNFPIEVLNVITLKAARPTGLTNPVLSFVVPRAMSHVVEHSSLRLVEAWELLTDELESQGLRPLGVTNRDFVHLKRIRNKLIAHRVPNQLSGKKHHRWYLRNYGSFEKVLALFTRIAEKLRLKIQRLQEQKRLPIVRSISKEPIWINEEDIRQVIRALKKEGIF